MFRVYGNNCLHFWKYSVCLKLLLAKERGSKISTLCLYHPDYLKVTE